MMLQNWDNDEVHQALSQFWTEYTYSLYFRTLD